MRAVRGRTFAVVLLCGLGASPPDSLFACDQDCSPSPNPIDIGVVPGYQLSRVKQINNRGDIVGQAVRVSNEPTQQAVLWHKVRGLPHEAEALPALDGFVRGDARGFATDRIPIGISFIPAGPIRAVAWRMDWTAGQRVAVDLEPPPGFTDAQAFSGNGLGLVAGDASNPKELVDGLVVRHAVLWRVTAAGGVTLCDLGVPDGFVTSTANDVNARGFVVGTARRHSATGSLVTTAFVWRPLGCRQACQFEAIPLASGSAVSTVQAPAINERGDVVAQATGSASSSAVLWRRHGHKYEDPETLPPPEGFTDALARAINARGDIVGTAQKRSPGKPISEARVVLWRRTSHGWTSSVLTSPSNTTLINSEHLNDRGDVIADTAFPPPGSSGAYLWMKATRRNCRQRAGSADASSLAQTLDAEIPPEPEGPSDVSELESPQIDVP